MPPDKKASPENRGLALSLTLNSNLHNRIVAAARDAGELPSAWITAAIMQRFASEEQTAQSIVDVLEQLRTGDAVFERPLRWQLSGLIAGLPPLVAAEAIARWARELP